MLSVGEPVSTIQYDKPLPAGQLRLGLTTQYKAFTRAVHGDDYMSYAEIAANFPAAMSHHGAKLYSWQTELMLRYAVDDRSEMFAALPFRRLRLVAVEETVHHQKQTLKGLADLRVGVRRFLRSDETLRFAGSLGLSLPTGSKPSLPTEAYLGSHVAAELGIDTPEHSHLRLGSGTVIPFLGIDLAYRPASTWTYLGSAQLTVPFYDASDGYRTATSATATLGAGRRVPDSEMSVTLFAGFTYAGRDEFHGQPVTGSLGTHNGQLDVTNTGRFEVSLFPTLSLPLSNGLTVEAQLSVPVYTRIHEDADQRDVQLTERAGLMFRLSYLR